MYTTSLYAALLTLLFVALGIRIISLRRRLKIGIGDAGNERMLRAMRVHANFAEYVPLALIMILLTELQGAAPLFVHALGLCLLAGRLSHAWGVSQTREKFIWRVAGMAMTFTTLLSAALYLLLVQGAALV